MPHSTDPQEQLLQRYLDGKCTPAEARELMSWLQSNGRHKALLQQMQEEFSQAFASKPSIDPEISDRMEARLLQHIGAPKVVRMPRRRIWLVAASVAVLITAGVLYLLTREISRQPPLASQTKIIAPKDIAPGSSKAVLTLADGSTVTLDSAGNQVIHQGQTLVQLNNGRLEYEADDIGPAVGYNTLSVPRGGQFTIVLPDGSRVWLNSASKLRYPTAFGGERRLVELEGQGYFDVKKDAEHPFIVKTKSLDVEVLGTGFDVMAYADEHSINTTLVEGAVRVKDVMLKPGQQARMEYSTGCIYVEPADIQQVIAWKTGFFEFDNARLADIMRQAARWYDIDVVMNEKGTGKAYGGRISRNLPLSELLNMLEASGARFNLQGRKLTVE
ncbi:FecR domain-containing protein [Chitinophaga sp. GCM10012297]|uniref:FecR domain-containing protein n=1 Tax=Chitinophaga chungangae TaxID=2821488 RepID=A0ABS3YBE6_9BACT|nr:FecR domain-containing protein [Chitinophaga chungangae]MBO9152002.1 FecR domain-containing protein [Chitinophaga chungangae]